MACINLRPCAIVSTDAKYSFGGQRGWVGVVMTLTRAVMWSTILSLPEMYASNYYSVQVLVNPRMFRILIVQFIVKTRFVYRRLEVQDTTEDLDSLIVFGRGMEIGGKEKNEKGVTVEMTFLFQVVGLS